MMQFLSVDQLATFLEDSFGKKKIEIKPLKGGLLNQNSLLTVAGKRYVLKVYRTEMTKEKVTEMHHLLKFISNYPIPVTLPISTVAIEDHVTALYPFVLGEHPPRYRNNHIRIKAMGDMLGQIHRALDDYRPKKEKPTAKRLIEAWQPNRSIEEIKFLRKELNSHPASVRKEINKVLDTYEKIYNEEGWDGDEFLDLPIRFCHGDYHMMNILMHGSHKVTAILDWEKANWDFRGKEIMRSIIFNCRKNSRELGWPSVETYLKTYKKHASLSDLDRSLAFESGLRNVVFSFWAIKQYLSGHKHFRLNILRRVAMMKGLVEHRKEYGEQISNMLK